MTTGTATTGTLAAAGDPLGPAFALITQLGDLWLYFVVLATLYWFGEYTPVIGEHVTRQRAATVVALAVGALALTTGLKEFFAIPRPPGAASAVGPGYLPSALEPAYVWAATADGYGFPSGHALGTTVVWGGLAWILEAPNRRNQLVAAAGVVALVSFSRVVLGVHTVGDVVVGVVVGTGYLVVVLSQADGPGRAFDVAAVVAVAGVALNGLSPANAQVLGTALGGALTWHLLGDAVAEQPATRREGVVAAAVGFPLIGVPFVGIEALEPPALVGFAVSAFLLVALLGLPVLVASVRDYRLAGVPSSRSG